MLKYMNYVVDSRKTKNENQNEEEYRQKKTTEKKIEFNINQATRTEIPKEIPT